MVWQFNPTKWAIVGEEKQTKMNKGLRSFLIKYPGFIAVTDGSRFTFEINGSLVIIVVVRKSLPIRINEFNNEILEKTEGNPEEKFVVEFKNKLDSTFSEKSQALVQGEFYYITEYEPPEKYRIVTNQYYTDLSLKFEVEDTEDEVERNEKFWRYLNYFLNIYRLSSNDVNIRLASTLHDKEILTHERCWKYDIEDLESEPEERMNSDKRAGFHWMPLVELTLGDFRKNKSKDTYNVEENTEKTTVAIMEGERGFWPFDILLKAKEELYHNNNYKYALLDAFIFTESIVSKFLEDIKFRKGISKKKLKDMEREVGISYKINIELPLFLDNISSDEKDTLRMIDKTRGIRNNVVHKGQDVTKEQAEEALQSAEQLMFMLTKRKDMPANDLDKINT